MQYEPVMGFMDEFTGNVVDQFFFYRQGGRSCLRNKTDPPAYPEYMCINRHPGLLVNNRCNYIGGFSPDTGQLHQFINGHGYLTIKGGNDLLCHTNQVLRFIVGIGNTFDQGE